MRNVEFSSALIEQLEENGDNACSPAFSLDTPILTEPEIR
jgi:hypothetical protein